MVAYIFPGQGSQKPGMGLDLYDSSTEVKDLFHKANEILGFDISDVMFNGTAEDLQETKVTQPAVFLNSIAHYFAHKPDMVPEAFAGHSLGEFTALTAAGSLSFEDGLSLVSKRALAMQEACEIEDGTMAAILGMENEQIEQICASIDEIVVPANYNCPGQLVISGSRKGVEIAVEILTEAGARRALILPVGGAFHSPLMKPAADRLLTAIEATKFQTPQAPVFQNVDAAPHLDPAIIKNNLISQLTSPVRWTQTMENMVASGISHFIESGGRVLSGFVKKLDRSLETESI